MEMRLSTERSRKEKRQGSDSLDAEDVHRGQRAPCFCLGDNLCVFQARISPHSATQQDAAFQGCGLRVQKGHFGNLCGHICQVLILTTCWTPGQAVERPAGTVVTFS